MVQVAREVRALLGKPEKSTLHFRELKHEQRLPFVRVVSGAPIRTVHVMAHKPSIQNPENYQQERHKLYRYLTRLLLERVSWLCRDNAQDGRCEADLIFSNRSAMSYDDLREYLDILLRMAALEGDVNIHWDAIDRNRVRAINHDQLAGLQIVDAVATSAFYAANKSQYGEVEGRYFEILKNTLYRNKGRVEGYGLKIWCSDADERKRLANLASLRS
jgi:hypothetical protein